METLLVLALPTVLAAGRIHLHLRATDRKLRQLRVERGNGARRLGRTGAKVVPLRTARWSHQAA
jgi:hypothetical protein